MHLAWKILLLFVFVSVAGAEPRVALVATRTVEPAPHDLTLPEKVGLFQAGEHRSLAFEVSGRVASLADEGARLAAGDVLAELESDLERARLTQAELRVRDAQAEFRRTTGLRKSGAASEKAFDSAETALELRRAERDEAREQLERRVLIAPFAGVVAETRAEPGEVVTPGSPVVMYMDLSQLRLELGVPGYQVASVREQAPVLVTLPALPGEHFDGVVTRVAPAAAEGQHLFEVEVSVANVLRRLRPGMSARARIVTRSLESAMVVPLRAAVEQDGGNVVFFVEDGRARSVRVTVSRAQGHDLVLEPAPEHRELVVRGQADLRDGMSVRVDNTILENTP